MNLIGNYKGWIDPFWITLVNTLPGKQRPDFKDLLNYFEKEQYRIAKEAGYDFSKPLWTIYEKDDLGIDIQPCWCKGKTSWWITKLMPGQYMPMHSDPFTHTKETRRYWMPLMDYQPGHIFIYKREMIKDYSLGDLFEFDSATDLHGAANIGYSPRVVLQISEYFEN